MGLATTPATLATGNFITAAIWNTEVRDNMNALGAGAYMGTPRTSGVAVSGTPTVAGGTETRDAILGNYVFTAVAGRRYRAIHDGMQCNGTVAEQFDCNIRNGGALTPTAASPLVASARSVIPASGSIGRQTVPISGTFVPGAGVQTLSLFTVRLNGVGVFTPISGTAGRELYVVDLGPA